MKRFPSKTNSIMIKLLTIFMILIPLTGMFIYNNYQSRYTLVNNIETTHKNLLESYWMQIDNQLNSAATFAINTALFNNDTQLSLSDDEATSALAKQRLSLKLADQIIIYANTIDELFVYTDNQFIAASHTSVNNEERSAIKSYLLESAPRFNPNSISSTWELITINNHASMIQFTAGNNGVLTGIYVNLDRLVSQYVPLDGSSSLYLMPTDDLIKFNREASEEHLSITASSSSAQISFMEIIPMNTILKTLPFMQKNTLAISVFVALLLPFIFFILRIIVVQPLKKLNNAMRQIQRGNLQYRIPSYRVSNEFAIVNQTFNQMMDEVQQLTISVYEEEIKAQKSQLRNLQLQIRPHFIINSLNMVYNLIENGDYTTAKKLIVHSVDFYRYMIKVDIDFVPLFEEIKHVNTYLQIQSIRYKNNFTFSIETNKMIDDMLVPPMLIQNFVENSIKYALRTDKRIHIGVKIYAFEVDFYPFAKIIISDTGGGYPTHQLQRLNQGEVIHDQHGEHIGIRNSVQRLSLLYAGKAEWQFYNQGGAVSEISLPVLFQDEMDHNQSF